MFDWMIKLEKQQDISFLFASDKKYLLSSLAVLIILTIAL